MGILKPIRKLFLSKKARRHLLVGPAHLWEMKRDFQLKFMRDQGLQPDHTLMDIGCGTLRGGIAFIDYLQSGNYYGIDVRQEAIDEGLKELEEEGLSHKNPDVRKFDHFKELSYDIKFDYVFAFAVLFHLEDHLVQDCFDFVAKALKKDGVFYANIFPDNREDANWLEFPVAFRDVEFYEEIAKKSQLQINVIDSLYNLGHKTKMRGDQQLMLEIKHA